MNRSTLKRLLTTACLLGGSAALSSLPASAQSKADLDKVSSSPVPQPAAAHAGSAPQQRAGNLFFTPPPGWKQEGSSEIIACIAPGLAPGDNFRILVLPGEEIKGDFQSAFDKQMRDVRTSLNSQLIAAGKFNELKGPQGSDALARTDIIELPSGVRWTCFLCCLHAGNRFEPIVTFASSAELYRKYLPDVNLFISRLRFVNAAVENARQQAARSQILVAGAPALTQEMVDRYNLFFEWLLDAPMTQEQRRQVQEALSADWKARNHTEIDNALRAVRFQEQIEQKTDSERDLLRASLQPTVLNTLQKQPNNPSARWVMALYDQAHRPIAAGTPSLTRQMTDSFIELLCFLHNQAVGGEPFAVSGDDKEQFARTLAADYSKYRPELQKHIASMPIMWAALRYRWPKLGETDRDAYKNKFRAYLKSIAPDYLKEVPSPHISQAGGQGGGALAEAARRQRQHNNYIFLSNMMTMRHVSMMNAFSNMGNSGYYYTYH